jgi:hypothetical protein
MRIGGAAAAAALESAFAAFGCTPFLLISCCSGSAALPDLLPLFSSERRSSKSAKETW